jgi:biotin synthase
MTQEDQALCFMAGAGSVFAGDKLLTTPNPEVSEDQKLFEILGLHARVPFKNGEQEGDMVNQIPSAQVEA